MGVHVCAHIMARVTAILRVFESATHPCDMLNDENSNTWSYMLTLVWIWSWLHPVLGFLRFQMKVFFLLLSGASIVKQKAGVGKETWKKEGWFKTPTKLISGY